jgi:hypothetical protein
LALWAADCAEHVLSYFEGEYPEDDRPRNAVEAGRAWVRGEIKMSEAGSAAFAAHAANYAVTAATDAAAPTARERDWQYRRLPKRLRSVAFPTRGDD